MSQQKNKKYWEFKAAAQGVGELYIYGDIVRYQYDDGDTSAKSFKRDLDALGNIQKLNLYINSPGGSVFEGEAIHNILKRHKAEKIAYIDALAASISSLIPMACNTIHMYSNSMMMIHWPWTFTWGNASQLRKEADNLDRIGTSMKQSYLDHAGDKLDDAKLTELLEAESWLTAQECLELGLCDVVGEENQVAACVSAELFEKYKNIPQSLQINQQHQSPKQSEQEAELRRQIAEDAKSHLEYINQTMGVIYQ